MAETPGTGHPDDRDAPDTLLTLRLRALETAYAELQAGQPGIALQATTEPSRVEALAAELAAYRTQMRDLEKSLVERIADVDDDRRLTAAKVQRGWQAQREEFGARLRRFGWLTGLALALALAIGGGGMAALYAYVRSAQTDLTNKITRRTAEQQQVTAQLESHRRALESLAKGMRQPPAPQDNPRPVRPAPATESVGDVLNASPDQSLPAIPVPEAPASLASETASAAAPATPPPDLAPPMIARLEQGRKTVTVADRPFALQLSGSHTRAKILKLAARPDLPAHVYIRTEVRQGRPWYVLIHSLHGRIEDARQARGQLPSDLRARSTWIHALPLGTSLDLVPSGRAP